MTTCSVIRCSNDADSVFVATGTNSHRRIETPICVYHLKRIHDGAHWNFDASQDSRSILMDSDVWPRVKEVKMGNTASGSDSGRGATVAITYARPGQDAQTAEFWLDSVWAKDLHKLIGTMLSSEAD